MMSECPLAICHKKGEYICRGDFVIRGRLLLFWSYGAFRLYLGASFCIYIFLAHNVFFVFVWVIHDRERYIDCICFLFHIAY